MGVGIHPTQTLFVPNVPTTLPAQHWEVERAPHGVCGKEYQGPQSPSPTGGLSPGVREGGTDPESRSEPGFTARS